MKHIVFLSLSFFYISACNTGNTESFASIDSLHNTYYITLDSTLHSTLELSENESKYSDQRVDFEIYKLFLTYEYNWLDGPLWKLDENNISFLDSLMVLENDFSNRPIVDFWKVVNSGSSNKDSILKVVKKLHLERDNLPNHSKPLFDRLSIEWSAGNKTPLYSANEKLQMFRDYAKGESVHSSEIMRALYRSEDTLYGDSDFYEIIEVAKNLGQDRCVARAFLNKAKSQFYNKKYIEMLTAADSAETYGIKTKDKCLKTSCAQYRGALYLLNSQLAEAAKEYEILYSLEPKFNRSKLLFLVNLISIYSGLKEYKKALKKIEIIEKQKQLNRTKIPDYMYHYVLGMKANGQLNLSIFNEADSTLKLLEVGVEQFPQKKPDLEYFKAEKHILLGDTVLAVDMLSGILKEGLSTRNPEVYESTHNRLLQLAEAGATTPQSVEFYTKILGNTNTLKDEDIDQRIRVSRVNNYNGRKKLDILKQQKLIQKARIRERRNQIFMWISIIIVLSLAISLSIVQYLLRKATEQNKILRDKVKSDMENIHDSRSRIEKLFSKQGPKLSQNIRKAEKCYIDKIGQEGALKEDSFSKSMEFITAADEVLKTLVDEISDEIVLLEDERILTSKQQVKLEVENTVE